MALVPSTSVSSGGSGSYTELVYTETTAGGTAVGSTEGTATTIVASGSVTYTGSQICMIEFFVPDCEAPTGVAGAYLSFVLFEDTTSLGRIAWVRTPTTTASTATPVLAARRRTPSAGAHTYTVKALSTAGGNGSWTAGAGGADVSLPGYIRVYQVG